MLESIYVNKLLCNLNIYKTYIFVNELLMIINNNIKGIIILLNFSISI